MIAGRSQQSALLLKLFVAVVAAAVAAGLTTPTGAAAGRQGQVSSGGDWYPQDLAGLSDSSESRELPVFGKSVVTQSQGLAVSLQPTLRVTGAPAGQYDFSVMTPGASNPTVLWTGGAGEPEKQVPAGVLASGRTYLWQAEPSGGGSTYGPYVMQVDVRRSGIQPSKEFGPLKVDLGTGAVSVAAALRSVAGASGKLGVSLTHRDEDLSEPGVPAGWQITAAGQTWDRVAVNDDESVELVSVSGMQYAFVPTSGGAYVARLAAGRLQATGSSATLVKNSDGSFTATMPSGQVAIFAAPVNDVGYLQQTFNGTVAGPSYGLTEGKVTSVRDGIDPTYGIDLKYQGVSGHSCDKASSGFVTVPDGKLCQIVYPDGSTASMSYRQVAGDAVLARVTDFPELRELDVKASVTDFAYDKSHRIVAVRGSSAAAALASGVRTDDAKVLTEVAYDASGRAVTITKPAALQGEPRPRFTIEYEPSYQTGESRTTIRQPNRSTTSGFMSRSVFDSSTFQVLESTGQKGRTASTQWRSGIDQVSSTRSGWGVRTLYDYDDDGFQKSVTGPFVGENPSSSAPKQTSTFDLDIKANQPVDQAKTLQGFNVTYWGNATLSDVPHSRTFGPKIEGNVPSEAQWNWTSSPTGEGAWGARLTGKLKIPKPSTGSGAQSYNFQVSSGSTLWVNNSECTSNSCTLPFEPGSYDIRVDAIAQAGGALGVQLQWQTPDDNGLTNIPMAKISPGYGLTTSLTQRDALGDAGVQQMTKVNQYQQPWLGKPTASWIDEATGTTTSTDFESFDPNQGDFGRKESTTLPAGNTHTYTYYGSDEQVQVPCSGMGSIDQNARVRHAVRAGDTYQYFYDEVGQRVAQSVNDQVRQCLYLDQTGAVVRDVTPARDGQPQSTRTITRLVDGNPLKVQEEVSFDGGESYTTSTKLDLYGKVVQRTGTWGVTTTATYDPLTGKIVASTVTSPTGKQVSKTVHSYNGDSQPIKITRNGETLATMTPPDASGTTITYGNGVQQQVSPTDVGALQKQAWTTSDGEKLSYQATLSPTQRVLSETMRLQGNKASFDYSYDEQSRLISADLDTNLDVDHTSWDYTFAGAAGRNSNRTKQIVDGKTTTTYQYDGDRLIKTSDPRFSSIGYSDHGEITTLGTVNLAYDAAGLVTSATDTVTKDSITYLRAGAGGPIIQKTSTPGNGEPAVTTRYAAGGLLLAGDNTPAYQVLGLPGGVNLFINLGTGSEEWQHQNARGQHTWTADAKGRDSGAYRLYSPYGEELITPAVDSPAPAPRPETGQPPESADPGSKPTKVTGLTVKWKDKKRKAVVSWGAPRSGDAQQYQVRVSKPDKVKKFKKWTTTEKSKKVYKKLKRNKTYKVHVRAVNDVGVSKKKGVKLRTKKQKKSRSKPVGIQPADAGRVETGVNASHRIADSQSTAAETSRPVSTDRSLTSSSTTSVPVPDLGWQAGYKLETDTVGVTDLIDMEARLYVPALGIFTSQDPVIGGGTSIYGYADADPVNKADPKGTMASWLKYLVSGIVAVAVAVGTVYTAGALAPAAIAAEASVTQVAAMTVGSAVVAGGVTFGADYAWFTFADGGHITKQDMSILIGEAALAATLAGGGAYASWQTAVGQAHVDELTAIADDFERQAAEVDRRVAVLGKVSRIWLKEQGVLETDLMFDDEAYNAAQQFKVEGHYGHWFVGEAHPWLDEDYAAAPGPMEFPHEGLSGYGTFS